MQPFSKISLLYHHIEQFMTIVALALYSLRPQPGKIKYAILQNFRIIVKDVSTNHAFPSYWGYFNFTSASFHNYVLYGQLRIFNFKLL